MSVIRIGVEYKEFSSQYNRIGKKMRGWPLMGKENKKIAQRAKKAGKNFLRRMETGQSA